MSSRSVAAARATEAASFACCSSSAGDGPPRRASSLCLGELAAQALDEGSGGLGAQRQPLASATECDQPPGGTVVASGRLGKRSFDLAAVARGSRRGALRPPSSCAVPGRQDARGRAGLVPPPGRLPGQHPVPPRLPRRPPARAPCSPSSLRSAAFRSTSSSSSRRRASSPPMDSRRMASRSRAPCRR